MMLGLTACDNDFLAKIGLGCFMEGKLCYESFNYSNTIQKSLVLTLAKDREYRIDEPFNKKDGTWINCTAINAKLTVCSMQVLKLPIDCGGRADIVRFDLQKWDLKFYGIELKENRTPPYIVNELSSNQLERLNLSKWAGKQGINPRQEVLCP